MNIKTYILLGLILAIIISCDRGPKIITSPVSDHTQEQSQPSGIFSDSPVEVTKSRPASNNDIHTVKIKEVLPTEKYVYLYVTDGEEEFWIATGKQTVQVGESYFYKGGLLKTNFESKEYNRVFDKVYLVSNISPVNTNKSMTKSPQTKGKEIVVRKKKFTKAEGSIPIANIIKDPQRYSGKQVQISGECVKLNANIMGRNWIHLQDGSKDDYDFVVTSDIPVPEGHIVTMTGILNIDLDFGAGYQYDFLVENAKIVR